MDVFRDEAPALGVEHVDLAGDAVDVESFFCTRILVEHFLVGRSFDFKIHVGLTRILKFGRGSLPALPAVVALGTNLATWIFFITKEIIEEVGRSEMLVTTFDAAVEFHICLCWGLGMEVLRIHARHSVLNRVEAFLGDDITMMRRIVH